MNASSEVRAWRQSLLWLLRSLYVARLAVCYLAMALGRHAEPDLVYLGLTTSLFVDLLIFLAAFFAYFPAGRRVILVESWLRPAALVALLGIGLQATARPGASLGWARGATGPVLLGIEFLAAPLLALLLVRAIGRTAAAGGLRSGARSTRRGPA
ncbi:MAG: hypothetical protein ACE5IK_03920 [Acidobacteriota bacterium]